MRTFFGLLLCLEGGKAHRARLHLSRAGGSPPGATLLSGVVSNANAAKATMNSPLQAPGPDSAQTVVTPAALVPDAAPTTAPTTTKPTPAQGDQRLDGVSRAANAVGLGDPNDSTGTVDPCYDTDKNMASVSGMVSCKYEMSVPYLYRWASDTYSPMCNHFSARFKHDNLLLMQEELSRRGVQDPAGRLQGMEWSWTALLYFFQEAFKMLLAIVFVPGIPIPDEGDFTPDHSGRRRDPDHNCPMLLDTLNQYCRERELESWKPMSRKERLKRGTLVGDEYGDTRRATVVTAAMDGGFVEEETASGKQMVFKRLLDPRRYVRAKLSTPAKIQLPMGYALFLPWSTRVQIVLFLGQILTASSETVMILSDRRPFLTGQQPFDWIDTRWTMQWFWLTFRVETLLPEMLPVMRLVIVTARVWHFYRKVYPPRTIRALLLILLVLASLEVSLWLPAMALVALVATPFIGAAYYLGIVLPSRSGDFDSSTSNAQQGGAGVLAFVGCAAAPWIVTEMMYHKSANTYLCSFSYLDFVLWPGTLQYASISNFLLFSILATVIVGGALALLHYLDIPNAILDEDVILKIWYSDPNPAKLVDKFVEEIHDLDVDDFAPIRIAKKTTIAPKKTATRALLDGSPPSDLSPTARGKTVREAKKTATSRNREVSPDAPSP